MANGQNELNSGKLELEENKKGLEDGRKELDTQKDAAVQKLAETKIRSAYQPSPHSAPPQ